jgi:hypothetical protein
VKVDTTLSPKHGVILEGHCRPGTNPTPRTSQTEQRMARLDYLFGFVAEPPKLFQLKCASHRYTADTNSMHFKRNNPLVCRVSARCNHGSTGSKQVYLARRRVYNYTTAHHLLVYRNINIITNHFNLTVNLCKHCLKQQAKQLVQVHSGRKITRDYTRREG